MPIIILRVATSTRYQIRPLFIRCLFVGSTRIRFSTTAPNDKNVDGLLSFYPYNFGRFTLLLSLSESVISNNDTVMSTATSSSSISASSNEALQYLKRVKPLDGWTVQVHPKLVGVRLLRRNVPLTDTYFFDIHLDPSTRCVVGILTSSSRNGDNKQQAQAQVLVDAKGVPLPSRPVQLMTVTSWKPTQLKPSTTTTASATTTTSSTTVSARDEENMQLLKFVWKHALVLIVGLSVARVLFTAVFFVYMVTIPILFLYMVQTCPEESTFDAKKELKRVLRGYHLPEDHPEKPKGFWKETLARVTASVVTELSTGLGYEISMTVSDSCLSIDVESKM